MKRMVLVGASMLVTFLVLGCAKSEPKSYAALEMEAEGDPVVLRERMMKMTEGLNFVQKPARFEVQRVLIRVTEDENGKLIFEPLGPWEDGE